VDDHPSRLDGAQGDACRALLLCLRLRVRYPCAEAPKRPRASRRTAPEWVPLRAYTGFRSGRRDLNSTALSGALFYRHLRAPKDRIGTHRKLWNGKHYDKHFLRVRQTVVDYPFRLIHC